MPQEWSLSDVFGRPIKGTCLVSSERLPVCIRVPENRPVFTSGGATEEKNGDLTCFELDPAQEFQVLLPVPEQNGDTVSNNEIDAYTSPREAPLLYADRSFMGFGQERGGIQAILTNPSADSEVEFVYFESLPWFMRIYLHTLEARIDGVDGSQPSIIEEIHYRPAVDRERGTQLELRMRIPPKSTVFLTYDFEKSILRYTEYPPDANRGFDVAAAVIKAFTPEGREVNLRTTTLLLSLPTPDFSMPYNVIIFTSTAIALAFGGMYNILVRRFVAADEGPSALQKLGLFRKFAALKGAIGAKFGTGRVAQ